jgi:hypothetical protein
MLTSTRKNSIGCGRSMLEARAQAAGLAACVPSLSLRERETRNGNHETGPGTGTGNRESERHLGTSFPC